MKHPLLRTREATRTYIRAILRHRTARRVHRRPESKQLELL